MVANQMISLQHCNMQTFWRVLPLTLVHLEPALLPPTERAAYYPSHLQVCQWKHFDLHCLKPDEWGSDQLTLLPTKKAVGPATESLLKYVRCKCHTPSKKYMRYTGM